MNSNGLLHYYGIAETALYLLVALLVAMRARSAWSAYENCTGLFVLWMIFAMPLDGAIGRDLPGIAYLIVAPIYGLASPLMYAIITRIRPHRPELVDADFKAPESSRLIRFLAATGRLAGRFVRIVCRTGDERRR